MNILTTLQALNSCFGPSGKEQGIARKLEDYARPYADEVYTDTLGNLIVHRKGSGPRVMISAHMDSIGFIVTHIEKEGYLRVGTVGGISPQEALCAPVRFKNGAMGVLSWNADVEAGKAKTDDLFLDVGAKDAKSAKAIANVGDIAVYATPTVRAGEAIMSPYLDNRISCVILLAVLEGLKDTENDLWFVFTVQEEVGIRGARTAAFAIDPDYAVAVDVTDSNDLPGSKKSCSSSAGGGAAIKVMDASVICHPKMVETLERLAKKGKITYQMDILSDGGTDAGAIHMSRGGVMTGGVSVPCRYVHSPMELVWEKDVLACIKLLTALCGEKLDPVPPVKE